MPAYHTNEIILADSQYLTRLALRKLLEPLSLVSSLTEAQNEQELCLMLHRSESPVVFLDYQKPGAFSLETIPLIQREAPRARIVLLTSDNSQEGIRQALEFGVDGFLTKHCDEGEILEALKAVGNGERFYCSQIIDFLLGKFSFRQEYACAPAILSPREMEIVRLTAQGLVAKQIADSLNLSPHTVYTHRKNIMQKLKVKNASQLVLFAVNKGWVERD